MTAEELVVELSRHLPEDGNITLEQSRFWCKVAETLSDAQLSALIRVTAALASPISMLIREIVLQKVREEANVQ